MEPVICQPIAINQSFLVFPLFINVNLTVQVQIILVISMFQYFRLITMVNDLASFTSTFIVLFITHHDKYITYIGHPYSKTNIYRIALFAQKQLLSVRLDKQTFSQ